MLPSSPLFLKHSVDDTQETTKHLHVAQSNSCAASAIIYSKIPNPSHITVSLSLYIYLSLLQAMSIYRSRTRTISLQSHLIMAFQRHRSWLLLLALACLLCLAATAAEAKRTGELTVFWGRNKDEGTLREACDTGLYNTVVISFFSVFGHGKYWTDLSGHPLHGIGADIKHCQSKGIPVFLSIGGGGTDYSLPSSASPEAVANHLWNAYLGGGSGDVFRPFGDAAVDGVDFYVDHGAPDNYDELARRLDYFNSMYYHATAKHVRLTATPRCAFPDRRLERALETGLFERIHVRFYGDEEERCSYKNGGVDGVVEEWEKWTARYPGSQLYVGLAAAESGVPDGAPPPVEVYLKYLYYDLLPKVQKADNYGGIMIWDRFTDNRTGYSTAVKGWASCSYGGCV